MGGAHALDRPLPHVLTEGIERSPNGETSVDTIVCNEYVW